MMKKNPPKDPVQLRILERNLTTQILHSTDVICATCIGTSHPMLNGYRFPVVIVDGEKFHRIFFESSQNFLNYELCEHMRVF